MNTSVTSSMKRNTDSTPLAQKATSLIALINRMRDIGAHILFDLPTIVFCGKQSSGKTSLIEALSGISLPRSDGTCTRTPSELRLTQTPPGTKWQCDVKLRYQQDDINNCQLKIDEFCEETFENEIFDKSKVEDVVRRAQNRLLTQSHSEEEPLKFSRNVVCIDIKGPEVGNLALIDLPGLIQTVEKNEDERFISVISDLVMEYISKESSIIAMAISCKDDMENQAIKSLANKVDPSGQRTIGILTKPDTIEEGCHDRYLEILQGRSYALRLGYYVVKNPTQNQINQGITHEEARKLEQQFFHSVKPWNQVGDQSRFGCSVLSQRLGQLLSAHIGSQIPLMRDTILADLSRTKKRLQEFATPIKEEFIQSELLKMICSLSDLVIDNVEANDRAPKDMFKSISQLNHDFWGQIRDCRPVFAVRPRDGFLETVEKKIDTVKSIVGINIEKQKHDNATQIFENMIDYVDTSQLDIHNNFDNLLLSSSNNGNTTIPSIWTADDILDLISSERGRHLPGNSSYEPTRKLIREFVEKWKHPSEVLVSGVRREFEEVLNSLINNIFGKYPVLFNEVSEILQKLLDKCEQEVLVNIHQLIEMELYCPFTQNYDYLSEFKKKCIHELSWCLAKNRDQLILEKQKEAKFQSSVQKLAKENGLDSDFVLKQFGQPEIDYHFVEVVNVMANVMSYFKLAFRRFGDIVPMTVDRQLLGKFSSTMRQHLIDELKIFKIDKADLQHLFYEDGFVIETRRMLSNRCQQLERAQKEILPFCPSTKSINRKLKFTNKKQKDMSKISKIKGNVSNYSRRINGLETIEVNLENNSQTKEVSLNNNNDLVSNLDANDIVIKTDISKDKNVFNNNKHNGILSNKLFGNGGDDSMLFGRKINSKNTSNSVNSNLIVENGSISDNDNSVRQNKVFGSKQNFKYVLCAVNI